MEILIFMQLQFGTFLLPPPPLLPRSTTTMRGAGRVRNKHVIEKNLIYIGNSLATNKNGANQSVGRNQPCPDE